MTEDDEIKIDPLKLFPEAARRVEILEKLKRLWPSIVGMALARYSCPCTLGVNELIIEIVNDQAKNRLANMKGNIMRGLARLKYDAGKNFTVRINVKESHETLPEKSKRVKVTESEEKLRQYMSNAPDTLPEDINYALSHLRAYLEGRR